MVVGKKIKGNKVGNRSLILYSLMLGDSIPCVKSHPVLPTAQGMVGPTISTDVLLFKLRIARHFTQDPRMRGDECRGRYGGAVLHDTMDLS